MVFRSGDDAVHPSYGVGNIVRLEERQLGGAQLQPYYVLAIGPATIWVPVGTDGSTTLRAVTAKKELDQYRLVLKGRPAPLERDHHKRRVEINERLKPGSFQSMCEVVRDLTALGWNRPIGEGDSSVLKKVRDNLRREWAASTGLSVPEAVQEVDSLLQAGRETYKQ